MKTSVILSALISASAPFLASAATCNADNCARAATGTQGAPGTSRLLSCSSFQQYTVTPATVTFTSTVFITPTPTTVFPTSIPSFAASSCNLSRYASACSCAGVTKVGVTVAPPSTTTTITMTAPSVVPADSSANPV